MNTLKGFSPGSEIAALTPFARNDNDPLQLENLHKINSMINRQCAVYMMSNIQNTVIYTGVTSDLIRRVLEHRSGTGSVFTKKYQLVKLVYYELGDDIRSAILREKQIKAGSRQKKIDLINQMNPDWTDLSEELLG